MQYHTTAITISPMVHFYKFAFVTLMFTKNKKATQKALLFCFLPFLWNGRTLGFAHSPWTANPSQTTFAFPLTRGGNPLGSPKIKSNAKSVAFLVLKSELYVCVVRVVRFWEFPAIFRGK